MRKIWTKEELVTLLKTNVKDVEELTSTARRYFYAPRFKSRPLYTVFDLLGKGNIKRIRNGLKAKRFNDMTAQHIDSFLESVGLKRNMHPDTYEPKISRKIITGRGDVDVTETLRAIEKFAEEYVAQQANDKILRKDIKTFLLAEIDDDTYGIKEDGKVIDDENLAGLLDLGITYNFQLLYFQGSDIRQNDLSRNAVLMLHAHLETLGLKLGQLKRENLSTPITDSKDNAPELVNEILDTLLGQALPFAKAAAVQEPDEETQFESDLATHESAGAEIKPAVAALIKADSREELIAFLKSSPSTHSALSQRIKTCLYNEDIKTMFEVIEMTEAELLRVPNFGRKSLNELKEFLAGHGLGTGMARNKTGVSDDNLSVEEFVDKFLREKNGVPPEPEIADTSERKFFASKYDIAWLTGEYTSAGQRTINLFKADYILNTLTSKEFNITVESHAASILNAAVKSVQNEIKNSLENDTHGIQAALSYPPNSFCDWVEGHWDVPRSFSNLSPDFIHAVLKSESFVSAIKEDTDNIRKAAREAILKPFVS